MLVRSLLAVFSSLAVFALVGCEAQPTAVTAPATTATPVSADASDVVVMDVPEMHCPFACWPKVQETLAAQPGVVDVELAPQQDENAIDNPKVFVRVADGFDADDAIGKLADAGFADSAVDAKN